MDWKINIFKLRRIHLLIIGIMLGVIAPIYYVFYGYGLFLLLLWVWSLVITGIYFFLQRKGEKKFIIGYTKSDLIIVFAILIMFAPLYLAFIYTVPFQINTDEIVIMSEERRLTDSVNPDIFAVSPYFHFPAFIFIIFGWLAKMIGGIDLYHVRLVHASFGLAIIVLSYFFFRTFLPKLFAIGGAVLVGSNHALLAISRMATRENADVFIEITALFFLFIAFRRNSLFFSFLGGAVAGLSLYSYFPGRMTIMLWLLFLVFLAIFLRSKIRLAMLTRLGIVSLLGFILVAAPIGAATIKELKSSESAFYYQKQQLLIFPEGRALQQRWESTPTVDEAVKRNILRGLAMFNNNAYDRGYAYPNYGHGFVDPLTGILIWFGILSIVLKSKKKEEDVLFLGSFVLLWLTFSLLTTKNPHYPRLLIILPFVAYVTIQGIKVISGGMGRVLQKLFSNSTFSFSHVLFGFIVGAIVFWNLFIFGDFVKKGLVEGHDVGGTARYVESRKYIPNYSFYLAANQSYPYYSWEMPAAWRTWIAFFAGEDQKTEVLDPTSFVASLSNPPFTIFMSQRLWQQSKSALTDAYPNLQIHNIKPDASLVAIEVN